MIAAPPVVALHYTLDEGQGSVAHDENSGMSARLDSRWAGLTWGPNYAHLDIGVFATRHAHALSPGNRDVTLAVRYRTSDPSGAANIAQVGTSGETSLVGVKMETVCRTDDGGRCTAEGGPARPRCAFTGSLDHVNLTGADVEVNDGVWHSIICRKTATAVWQVVDGRVTERRDLAIGSIDTGYAPFMFGGKADRKLDAHDAVHGDIGDVRLLEQAAD